MQIEQDAVGGVGLDTVQELFTRREGFRLVPQNRYKTRQRSANAKVIIDDCNERIVSRHIRHYAVVQTATAQGNTLVKKTCA